MIVVYFSCIFWHCRISPLTSIVIALFNHFVRDNSILFVVETNMMPQMLLVHANIQFHLLTLMWFQIKSIWISSMEHKILKSLVHIHFNYNQQSSKCSSFMEEMVWNYMRWQDFHFWVAFSLECSFKDLFPIWGTWCAPSSSNLHIYCSSVKCFNEQALSIQLHG